MELSEIASQQDKLSQQSLTSASVPDFLIKTYQMLEDDKHNTKISWSKDGTMIIIKKPLEFAEELLPLYFKHNNLASFIRQLNNYSFRKMKSKEYEYCFYHESFCRGRKDLLKFIKRKKSPRSKGSKSHAKHGNAKKSHAAKAKHSVEPSKVKKVHVEEDRTAPNAALQEQIAQLTRTNEQLKDELMKRQAQDRSLRYIISVLTSYYGAENVQNVLKIADTLKPQDLVVAENFMPLRGSTFFESSPNEPILQTHAQSNLEQFTNPQEFIEYDNYYNPERLEHGLNHDNGLHAEGIEETADNNSGTPSPYFQETNKDGTNQITNDNNLQSETDYFRKILSGTSFPPSNLLNPFSN